MKQSSSSYPDISDILARKAEGRVRLSRLTFSEKVSRVEALQDRLKAFEIVRRSRTGGASERGKLAAG